MSLDLQLWVLTTHNTISLRSERIGSARTDQHGEEIGIARVYDFALESGSYNTSNLQLNQWDLSLYDVQTYTKNSTINENIDLNYSTFM